MPQIVFLPHADHCPEGAVVEAQPGETVLDAALRNGIDIEHACEKSCACTTCHVVIREGFEPECDALARDALLHAEFEPARTPEGRPIASSLRYEYSFALAEDP